MLKFIGKRLLMMIPVILGISFIIFTILAMTPGDPAQMILGENATPEAIAEKREELGLNENLFVRYFKYMGNALTGDFGRSYRTNLPVWDELMTRFPNTLVLAFFGIGLAVIMLGILIQIKFGKKKDEKRDEPAAKTLDKATDL